MMAIQDLRYWHWLAISVLLGPLLGYARLTMREVNLPPGDNIGQALFEKQLAARNSNGLPRLRNMVLHPHPLQAGSYLITANLVESIVDDDPGQPIWLEATTPYLSSPGPDGDRSVIAFLNAQRQRNPSLSYRLAWWERPPYLIASWIIGTVILLGGVWPFLVNMLVFGSILRPREAVAKDMAETEKPAQGVKRAGPGRQKDLDMMAAIDGAIQAEPETCRPAMTESVPRGEQCLPPPRPLQSSPVLPILGSSDGAEQRTYGGTEEDFYPTELGGRQLPR